MERDELLDAVVEIIDEVRELMAEPSDERQPSVSDADLERVLERFKRIRMNLEDFGRLPPALHRYATISRKVSNQWPSETDLVENIERVERAYCEFTPTPDGA